MPDPYDEILALLRRGDKGAMATLITRLGSAPGALGAKMLVRPDGTAVGSIGGGCVEADVWQAAMTALETGTTEVLHFRLSGRDAAESGLICGGEIDVLVEPVEPGQLAAFEALTLARERGDPGVLATPLAPSSRAGHKFFVTRGDEAALASDSGVWRKAAADALAAGGAAPLRVLDIETKDGRERLLVEFLMRPITLIVLGAGHISREIVPLAKRVFFRVVVVDDRPHFANKNNFPEADEVMVAEFAEILDLVPLDRETYVLIITRGHLHDELLLEWALQSQAGYIGMIGSRTKIRTLYHRLRARGTSEERLAFVHAPVGLPIGARQPEEIAVSIVAELISVRNGGQESARSCHPVLRLTATGQSNG